MFKVNHLFKRSPFKTKCKILKRLFVGGVMVLLCLAHDVFQDHIVVLLLKVIPPQHRLEDLLRRE